MDGPQERPNIFPPSESICLRIPKPCFPSQHQRPQCPHWVLLSQNIPLSHVTNCVHGYHTNHHLGMVFQCNPLPDPMGASRGNLKKDQCPTQHLYQPFTPNFSKAKDPNMMDVNVIHVEKLTLEERKCCIKKGLCFHC